MVGERTNVLGSRKFKGLIQAGEHEAAAEVGRAQVKAGGQVLDVCLQDPDRDEITDMEGFLDRLVRLVKAPLMIDSTDAVVMERALTFCQGKSILNSINLEDGRSRFDRVVPLARRFGAALVVGLIDEKGMAVDVERKVEVARRSYQILVEEYGVQPEDLWWDALVFPCGTGDLAYVGSAAQTIEGVRAVKEIFPDSKTVLGISNVSFGLPPAGREILNSVFLFHCTKAGLDAAIVNTEKLARYADIPAEERELAESLIFLPLGDVEAGNKAVEEFTAHFRGRTSAAVRPRAELPLAERIARAVVEGSKTGLEADLAEALVDPRWPAALDIINGPLMAGMSEVGRLFNDNQLIVAEVLQSAEVMKAAVSFLEPHMEKALDGSSSSRGKVLLATVKGDVHDIGKNLVDIVLFEQRLHGGEPGDQGPLRAADPGGARAPAGRHRPLRAAGEERPADGADGGRPGGGRHRHPAPGRRRGAHPPLHTQEDRPELHRALHLRQGRHARPQAGRAAARSGARNRGSRPR